MRGSLSLPERAALSRKIAAEHRELAASLIRTAQEIEHRAALMDAGIDRDKIEAELRFRVTVRADDIEVRGYVDSLTTLQRLADAVKPLAAVVVASPAEDDYDPFNPDDVSVPPEWAG